MESDEDDALFAAALSQFEAGKAPAASAEPSYRPETHCDVSLHQQQHQQPLRSANGGGGRMAAGGGLSGSAGIRKLFMGSRQHDAYITGCQQQEPRASLGVPQLAGRTAAVGQHWQDPGAVPPPQQHQHQHQQPRSTAWDGRPAEGYGDAPPAVQHPPPMQLGRPQQIAGPPQHRQQQQEQYRFHQQHRQHQSAAPAAWPGSGGWQHPQSACGIPPSAVATAQAWGGGTAAAAGAGAGAALPAAQHPPSLHPDGHEAMQPQPPHQRAAQQQLPMPPQQPPQEASGQTAYRGGSGPPAAGCAAWGPAPGGSGSGMPAAAPAGGNTAAPSLHTAGGADARDGVGQGPGSSMDPRQQGGAVQAPAAGGAAPGATKGPAAAEAAAEALEEPAAAKGAAGFSEGPAAAGEATGVSEGPAVIEAAAVPGGPGAAEAAPSKAPKRRLKQLFDALLVLDIEATCDRDKAAQLQPQEIIELSCVIVDTATCQLRGCWQRYVKPDQHPQLTEFCTELTGITQEQVDAGVPLRIALQEQETWLREEGLIGQGRTFVPVTWRDWDLKVMMASECKWRNIDQPKYLKRWVDLSAVWFKHSNGKRGNLRTSVEAAGLEWEGRAHSAIDDARNTARLAVRLMQSGVILGVTGSFGNLDASGRFRQGTLLGLATSGGAAGGPSGAASGPANSKNAGGGSGKQQGGAQPAQKRQRIYDQAGVWTGKCYCGAKAKERTVKRPGPNNGKEFWSCGRFTMTGGAGCDFFKFMDDIGAPPAGSAAGSGRQKQQRR